MIRYLVGVGAAVAALLFGADALAQCSGSPAANSICAGVASGNPGPIKLRQMVLPDLPQIPTGAVIGNNSGATGRPVALSATDLAGVLGIFTASNSGLVPAPQTQTSFTEPVFIPSSNALGTAAVPNNLYEFYSVNADAVWRPKTGSFQYVSSGTAQIDPDAGLVLVNNASGAPISLGLPPEANVQPGWVIRVAVLAADATQTVTIAAAAGDDIQSQGADVNPVVITSPRSTQFTAAGSFPWAFANFGAPTSQFAGMVPPNNGAAGSYLDVNLQWTVPGGGGGSPILPDIPDQTVLGNVSGMLAQPSALTQVQLQSLIGQFTATLPGLVPAAGVGTPATDVLQANGAFGQVAAGSVSGLGPLATSSGLAINQQVFTAANCNTGTAPDGVSTTCTYTPLGNPQFTIAECRGGGSGGGNVAVVPGSMGGGGGGGQGAYVRSVLPAAAVGTGQLITIGAGGAGGTAGVGPAVSGGNSSVGTLVVAPGATSDGSNQSFGASSTGLGGFGGATAQSMSNGAASPVGQFVIPGGDGAHGGSGLSSWNPNGTVNQVLGWGGAGFAGARGLSATASTAVAGLNATAGTGGGGSGAAGANSVNATGGVAANGGTGGSGWCAMTEIAF